MKKVYSGYVLMLIDELEEYSDVIKESLKDSKLDYHIADDMGFEVVVAEGTKEQFEMYFNSIPEVLELWGQTGIEVVEEMIGDGTLMISE